MRILPKSIEKMIAEFSRLPGIGSKTASRLTFYLLKVSPVQFGQFVEAVSGLKNNVQQCRQCCNMAEAELCDICKDSKRDKRLICVVEDPLDVMALEQTKSFTGTYHVLGGAISPIDGVGPEQLKIDELVERVNALRKDSSESVEIILATNPSLEGDATAMYIARELKPAQAKITKLARGIPVGGDLEYTDEQTLTDAIKNRKEI